MAEDQAPQEPVGDDPPGVGSVSDEWDETARKALVRELMEHLANRLPGLT